jgi:hypothetical protein
VENFPDFDRQYRKIATIYTDSFQALTTGSHLVGYFNGFARSRNCVVGVDQ